MKKQSRPLELAFVVVFCGWVTGLNSQDKNPIDALKPGGAIPAVMKGFARHIHTSVTGRIRSIVVTEGKTKLEIDEIKGTSITMRVTREIEGIPESIEVQAKNLADLKAKSPDSASLFEQYTAVRVFGAGRNVTDGRLPFRNNRQLPIERFEPNQIMPRRIRVDLDDRRLEICDGPDSIIRVKLIKTKDENEQSDEVIANQIQEMKKSYPDFFKLYAKYTGLTDGSQADSSTDH